ncbi:MAG: DUF4340 domain-containing protein [Anaerolineae bacterium]|nr:DUF4340 domain-containing protein [Anaerolineae bacterium]CAG1011053.1 hypothetical protein ANRL4_04321 [Anaerolineae bacterium]
MSTEPRPPRSKRARAAASSSRLLIIVFAILMMAVYLIVSSRRFTPVTSGSNPTVPYLFPAVEPTIITRITLENRQTGAVLSLTKIPGDWHGEDKNGETVTVDLTKMPELLRTLTILRYNRILEDSALEQFGLKDGGWFRIRFEAGKTYTLDIGAQNPDRSLTYVQRNGEPAVILVPSVQVEALTRLLQGEAAP